jgi:hypothetical protein
MSSSLLSNLSLAASAGVVLSNLSLTASAGVVLLLVLFFPVAAVAM